MNLVYDESDQPSLSKVTLRRKLLDWRKKLPSAQKKIADQSIIQNVSYVLREVSCNSGMASISSETDFLKDLFQAASNKILGVYWPIQKEPDLRDAFFAWQKEGWSLAFPRAVAPEQSLEFGHCDFFSSDSWTDGLCGSDFFGIPIPEPFEIVSPDVLLIPCVGFNRMGYRLGYGGGFYDRTLAIYTKNIPYIGIAYSECELSHSFFEPNDFPMNVIVTESKIFCMRFARIVE